MQKGHTLLPNVMVLRLALAAAVTKCWPRVPIHAVAVSPHPTPTLVVSQVRQARSAKELNLHLFQLAPRRLGLVFQARQARSAKVLYLLLPTWRCLLRRDFQPPREGLRTPPLKMAPLACHVSTLVRAPGLLAAVGPRVPHIYHTPCKTALPHLAPPARGLANENIMVRSPALCRPASPQPLSPKLCTLPFSPGPPNWPGVFPVLLGGLPPPPFFLHHRKRPARGVPLAPTQRRLARLVHAWDALHAVGDICDWCATICKIIVAHQP